MAFSGPAGTNASSASSCSLTIIDAWMFPPSRAVPCPSVSVSAMLCACSLRRRALSGESAARAESTYCAGQDIWRTIHSRLLLSLCQCIAVVGISAPHVAIWCTKSLRLSVRVLVGLRSCCFACACKAVLKAAHRIR